MNQDVVPADKELRKKFIIFIVFVTIVAIVIEPYIKGYLDQIEQLSQKDPELAFKKSMFILKVALGFVSLLLLSMGVYFVLLARKTLRSGQYPPPGMRGRGPYAFEKTLLKKKSSDTKRNISEKERGVIELKEKGGETK